MDDRAVSETVGFVLTFAMIITSIALVTTYGFDQIETIRDNEQLENAERSFLIVSQNINEIQDGRSVVRSGTLDLDRGDIALIPPAESQLHVEVHDNGSGEAADYHETIPMSGIRYRLRDTVIGYEGGAVIRNDTNGGAVVQERPTFLCKDDTAIVSVVRVRGDQGRQLGSGTVSVTVERSNSSILFPLNRTGINSTEDGANVAIAVTDSPFASAWNRSLLRQGWTATADGYECQDVTSYHVVRTTVRVTFTR